MFESVAAGLVSYEDVNDYRSRHKEEPNFVIRISEAEILDAEKALGYSLPTQLRTWYLEWGYGFIKASADGRKRTISHNRVCPPSELPELIDGTCEWMMPYTKIQPRTLPFFDRDVDLFLCLHPHASNPNAVHWMWGDKICDSLVEFFQRLIVDPDWLNPPKL